MAHVAFLINLVICGCLFASVAAESATSGQGDVGVGVGVGVGVDRTKKSVGPYLNGFNGHEYDNGQYHSHLYNNPVFNTGKYDPLFDNPAAAYYNARPATFVQPGYNAAKYNYNTAAVAAYYNPYYNNPYANSAIYNPAVFNPYSVHSLKYNPYNNPHSYVSQKVVGAVTNYNLASPYPETSFAYQAAYPGAYLNPSYHGANPYSRVLQPTSAYVSAQRSSSATSSASSASSASSQVSAIGEQKHGY